MKYVNLEACRNDPHDTPNVAMIRVEGVRLIYGRIPQEVRRELMAGVARGRLGRLRKEHLKPEAFFHPNSRANAIGLRNREALAGVQAIAKVLVRASDLPEHQQAKLFALHTKLEANAAEPAEIVLVDTADTIAVEQARAPKP